MAILRYSIKCPGCSSNILLRLGVGIHEIQKFYFVCDHCTAVTKATLRITYPENPNDQQGVKWDLQLEEGEICTAEHDTPDQILTLHPDFPSILNMTPNLELDASQFLLQIRLMGGFDGLHNYQTRLKDFNYVIKSDWARIKRLITYYIEERWVQFNTEGTRIFEEIWPQVDTAFARHDIFHRVVEMFFAPAQPNLQYPDLKAEYNKLFGELFKEKPAEMQSYVHNENVRKDLLQLQRGLLERLAFFVDHFDALIPAFPILFYTDKSRERLKHLRIIRDDFELLKANYIECFELLHKLLVFLIGLQNIYYRCNPDLFLDGKPSSLRAFKKLPNAEKAKRIDEEVMPLLSAEWNHTMSSKVRNAIGHSNVRHELRTGALLIDNGDSVPYSEFVANSLYFLPLLLYGLQVIKMGLISATVYQNK